MRRRPPDAGGWAGAVPVEEGEAVGVRTCLQGRALTGRLDVALCQLHSPSERWA